MSLETRVLALATSIGQRIKALEATVAAGSGGGGSTWPTMTHTGAAATNSTVTPASVTACSRTLEPGVYRITGLVIWRSAATGTGASFFVRGSGGTITRSVGHWYHLTTGGAATTGISDQDTAGVATGQMIEGKGWRANNVDPGPVVGVDTANADELAMIECMLTVTATSIGQLMFRSETAGTAISVMDGTHLKYEKVA